MSTERMNDNQGTARMDNARMGDGTDRMDAGTARMQTTTASPQKTGVVFSSGQAVVLNGRNCVIDSTISMGSGEAFVYKVIIDVVASDNHIVGLKSDGTVVAVGKNDAEITNNNIAN